MEYPADAAPPLVATPRHLRRRRLHEDIPDTLLVAGAEAVPLGSERGSSAKRAAAQDIDDAEVIYRRKRLAALLTVIFVVVSVPCLILALLLFG
ncbi:hypothetical protein [Arthrobacter sp. ov118]|uniref:hypothetical protein n=1 Tax=Arthrobacter sp. ov118 TaxID=1761747 RepID=UPI0008E0E116|nr:hypothetical protein [Arthrobacter sp. ov118]SFT65854.1 hypothetical protein SAMN04487915_10265 [Arthrobacter sp. ov118]